MAQARRLRQAYFLHACAIGGAGGLCGSKLYNFSIMHFSPDCHKVKVLKQHFVSGAAESSANAQGQQRDSAER